jgi:hypothetical protein
LSLVSAGHVGRQHKRGQGAQPPVVLDTRAQVATHVPPRPIADSRLNTWSKEARYSASRTAHKLAAAYDAVFFAEDAAWSRARATPGELPNGARKPRSDAAHAAELRRCAVARLGHCNRAAAVLSCGHAQVGYAAVTGELLTSKTGVPTAIVDKCGDRLCVDCAAPLAHRRRSALMERLHELQKRTRLIGPVWQRTPHEDQPMGEAALAIVREAERLRYAVSLGDDVDIREVTALADAEPPPPKRGGRSQRRPPLVPDVLTHAVHIGDGVHLLTATRRPPRRRRREHFRIGPPLAAPKNAAGAPMHNVDIYGCRFTTFTQPIRKNETLSESLSRLLEAMRRTTRSPVWKAHVDMSVIRYEHERSTPKKREQKAREHERAGEHERAAELRSRANDGEWWHCHAHALMWGSFFPQSPSLAVQLDRDPEDSLLMVWRRALVETGIYDEELFRHAHPGAAVVPELIERYGAKLRADIRRCAHASNGRCWSLPLRAKGSDGKPLVRIGGIHVKSPERRHGEKKLTPEEALAEVIKYVCKPAALGELRHDLVVEVVEATRGRRLVRATGLLYGVHLYDDSEAEETDDTEGVDIERGERVAWTASGLCVSLSAVSWRSDNDAREERRAALEKRERRIASEGEWPWPNTS